NDHIAACRRAAVGEGTELASGDVQTGGANPCRLGKSQWHIERLIIASSGSAGCRSYQETTGASEEANTRAIRQIDCEANRGGVKVIAGNLDVGHRVVLTDNRGTRPKVNGGSTDVDVSVELLSRERSTYVCHRDSWCEVDRTISVDGTGSVRVDMAYSGEP